MQCTLNAHAPATYNGRRLAVTLVALTALTVVGLPAAGASTPAAFATTTECQEHQAFVDGDAAAVAGRLPHRYNAVEDPTNGRPVLFVRGIRCPLLTIDGRSGPVTMASFGIVINSPDGGGCASGAPVVGTVKGDFPPACNWYVLLWLANDRRVVDWLRAGTPDFPAVYAPGLVFQSGAFDPTRGGAPFHLEAPASTPSPFAVDAVGRERPGELPIRGGYWTDTPAGTVKVAFSTENLTSGDANGVVTASSHSQLATLLGAEQRSYTPGFSAFSAERWSSAVYRKQMTSPAAPGHSFAGSCSVQGSVSFDPPATNTDVPLHYGYSATGTCDGTLDGRTIAAAPVTLGQSGSSYGSCASAHTTAPGSGTLAFRRGQVIGYTLDFTSAGTEVNFTLYGDRSGTATAHGSFLTPRTPPDVALHCATDGVSQIPMDTTLSTSEPLR
jgi:hypothetical protein